MKEQAQWMVWLTGKPRQPYDWLDTARIDLAKKQTAWTFDRQTPGGGLKKKENPGALRAPSMISKFKVWLQWIPEPTTSLLELCGSRSPVFAELAREA
jgi:hypothetical protein